MTNENGGQSVSVWLSLTDCCTFNRMSLFRVVRPLVFKPFTLVLDFLRARGFMTKNQFEVFL